MWDFEKYPQNVALVSDRGERVSYQELAEKGRQITQTIQTRSVVFSLCKNQIASVIGYTAFLNHQIVPILLNAKMDMGLLKRLMETYKPGFLWIPEELRKQFESFEEVYRCYDYYLLKTHYNSDYILHDKLGLLLTTSGSTGSPKLVRQSYKNILENAKSIVEYLQLNEEERPVTTLPMNYTYGLSIINSHLLVGATILLTDYNMLQKEFWEFLRKEKATSFSGVPYTYEILDKLRFFRMELPDLNYMTQAGGKLSPELHRKFAEYAKAKGKNLL